MKVLFVGDPHVVTSEFKDCWGLIDGIETTAKKCRVDYICILGDLYHNHSIIDSEVMLFWDQALRRLRKYANLILIKGNHDQPNNKVSAASSLLAHSQLEGVVVAGSDSVEIEGVLFCPYSASETKLVEWSHASEAKTLVCHNTFHGATYENGTIAHDYYDQSKIKQETIISGHIHTPMVLRALGREVIYPGAPRWRTVSDANVDRSLMVVEFTDGVITDKSTYPTSAFCFPYIHLQDSEKSPLEPLTPSPNARYVIDLLGSETWIKDRKALYPFAKIRTFPTSKAINLKESDGLDVSMAKWMEQYVPVNKTPHKILQERLVALWPSLQKA